MILPRTHSDLICSDRRKVENLSKKRNGQRALINGAKETQNTAELVALADDSPPAGRNKAFVAALVARGESVEEDLDPINLLANDLASRWHAISQTLTYKGVSKKIMIASSTGANEYGYFKYIVTVPAQIDELRKEIQKLCPVFSYDRCSSNDVPKPEYKVDEDVKLIDSCLQDDEIKTLFKHIVNGDEPNSEHAH